MTRRAYNHAAFVVTYNILVSDEAIEKHGDAASAVRAALGDVDTLHEELTADIVAFNDDNPSLDVTRIDVEVKK